MPPAGSHLATRAAAAAQVFVDDPADPRPSSEDRHHLSRVLRLRDGEQVVASDGRGTWTLCVFRAAAGAGAGSSAGDGPGVLEVTDPPVTEPAPAPGITVAFAPPKGDRTEWAVQKLTELGVDTIVPLLAEHSVVRWEAGRAERALERLRRVARSASAQCRRVWLPEIGEVRTVAELAAHGGVALAQPGGDPPSLRHPVVAVGPEGGWSEAERSLKLPEVGLGPLVLRAETAVIVSGALLAALRAGTVVDAGDGSRADPGPR